MDYSSGFTNMSMIQMHTQIQSANASGGVKNYGAKSRPKPGNLMIRGLNLEILAQIDFTHFFVCQYTVRIAVFDYRTVA